MVAGGINSQKAPTLTHIFLIKHHRLTKNGFSYYKFRNHGNPITLARNNL